MKSTSKFTKKIWKNSKLISKQSKKNSKNTFLNLSKSEKTGRSWRKNSKLWSWTVTKSILPRNPWLTSTSKSRKFHPNRFLTLRNAFRNWKILKRSMLPRKRKKKPKNPNKRKNKNDLLHSEIFKIRWSDFGPFKLAEIGSDSFKCWHLIFLHIQPSPLPLLEHLLASGNEF